jgi:hypothetical protein
MLFRDYIQQRLDQGETNAVIEGLQNNITSNLADAVRTVPPEDWDAEVTNRQKEADGQTLIWLADRPDPAYTIQE